MNIIKQSPTVIIINGHPATGKTTLGYKLQNETGLMFFHKDGIKELLFDTLGIKDLEWSKRLGYAAYQILFHILRSTLAGGNSLIIEANFDPIQAASTFKDIEKAFPLKFVEIYCETDPEVLIQRYKSRIGTVDRHFGHTGEDVEELIKRINEYPDIKLYITEDIISYNTSSYSENREQGVIDQVLKVISI